MRVHVFEEFRPVVSEPLIRNAVECALASAGEHHESALVEVAIVDDASIRDLNGRYRGLDEVTDVLSFSFDGATGYDEAEVFATPPGMRSALGEIVVSYPQAARQAEGAGRSIGRELASLLVHGLLHLAGHDHEEPGERAEMEARERTAMSQVAWDG